jgi:hypothetical protein
MELEMIKSPPPVHVTVSDPNHIPETVVTGPINLQVGPEVSVLTLTSLQPNFEKLMQGQLDPAPRAFVTVKAIFPTSQLRGLHASLGHALNTLAVQASGAAPNGGIVMPGGDSSH